VPSRRSFRLAPNQCPGIQAPLGWVLSGAATRDLDDQREALARGADWKALRRLLDGEVECRD
jgi:hypothetical protein